MLRCNSSNGRTSHFCETGNDGRGWILGVEVKAVEREREAAVGFGLS